MPQRASSIKSPHQITRSRKSRTDEVEVPVPVAGQSIELSPAVHGESEDSPSRKKPAENTDSKTYASDSVNNDEPVQKSSGTKRKRKIAVERDLLVDGDKSRKNKRSKTIKEEDHDKQLDGETSQALKGKIKKKAEGGKKEDILLSTTSQKTKVQIRDTIKLETEEAGAIIEGPETPKNSQGKKKTKVKQEPAEVNEGGEDVKSSQKAKRKRKTKEEKEAEAMPLAARTVGLNMFIGAHVSCAKGPLARLCIPMYIASMKLNHFFGIGVHNTVTNCLHIG